MPPISCTSKWRICSTRFAASRTTANASGSSASSDSPCAQRALNSAVLALSASSDRAEITGSSALICRTTTEYCFNSRSLRLPKMRVRMLIMRSSVVDTGAKNKG